MDEFLKKIVDGDYNIQPNISVALDGGTITFVVKDDSGNTEAIYLDRRMMTETENVFYKGAYPGREGSVLLGKNEALVAKIDDISEKSLGKTE